MANRTKKDRIEGWFIAEGVREKNVNSRDLSRVFENVWNQIPSALSKKLNTDELKDYIRIHLLPKTQFKPRANSYQQSQVTTGNRRRFEVLA